MFFRKACFFLFNELFMVPRRIVSRTVSGVRVLRDGLWDGLWGRALGTGSGDGLGETAPRDGLQGRTLGTDSRHEPRDSEAAPETTSETVLRDGLSARAA